MIKQKDLDKAKLMQQGKEIAEDKMDQNEDLAELRAETSIESADNFAIKQKSYYA